MNTDTNTSADLRKVSIHEIDRLILLYGENKQEDILTLTRWDKVNLLRKIANEHPDIEELAKYAQKDARKTD